MNFRLFLIISVLVFTQATLAANRRHPLFGIKGASQPCEDNLISRPRLTLPAELARISYGLGSTVQEVARHPSVLSQHDIVWLESHENASWNPTWSSHDLAGDVRWGQKLLDSRAMVYGFMMRHEGKAEQYSVPDVDHQNWSLDKYDSENPFRIVKTNGGKTAREVLEGFAKGQIFADVTRSRAYLHHVNYHFISLLLLKHEVLQSMQRRAQLILKFGAFTAERASKKGEKDDLVALDMFYEEAASRLDLIANIVPLLGAIQDGKIEEARRIAGLVRTDVSSLSDAVYIFSLAQTVAQEAPFGRTRFTPDVRRDLEIFDKANPGLVLQRDEGLTEFGNALRRFADDGDIKEVSHFHR